MTRRWQAVRQIGCPKSWSGPDNSLDDVWVELFLFRGGLVVPPKLVETVGHLRQLLANLLRRSLTQIGTVHRNGRADLAAKAVAKTDGDERGEFHSGLL